MRFKNLGIFVLLLAVIVLTTLWNGLFADPGNIRALIRDTSLYGLISIGVAFVIITGGIDLSIGSLIALSGVIFITMANIQKYEVDYQSTVTDVVMVQDDIAVSLAERLPAVQAGDQLRTPSGQFVV